MAYLRVYNANGEDIYKLMKQKKEEKRVIKLDTRIVKNRLESSFHGNLDNIPAVNIGKKTGQRQILKSAIGL